MRFIAIFWLCASSGVGTQAEPLRAVVDVRSNHSDGAHSFEELIALAKKRRIDVIAFTEHDRQTIRFAPEPLIRFFGIEKERPSLATTGLDDFFADLAAVRARHPELVLLAGVEATPGYRWQWRFPWHWRLVDAEKHLIALGIERPGQIEALPSWRLSSIAADRMFSALFWAFLFLIFLMIFRKNGKAVLFLSISLIGLLGWIALRPPPDAIGAFITTARNEGLFVAWAHPGTRSGVRPGPFGVQLVTPPYEEAVFAQPADAFAALYGDTDRLTLPGGAWDRWMQRWARGNKPPVWAIAAGDFHAEGEAGEHLGNFPMDVWADARTPDAVLAALSAGHMVAWGLPKGLDLSVRQLFLEDDAGARAIPGDRLRTNGRGLALMLAIRDLNHRSPMRLAVDLVLDGKTKRFFVRSDGGAVRVPLALAAGVHLLQLRIRQGTIRMEANPMAIEVVR